MTDQILLTGATGTVGSSVLRYLRNESADLIVATRNPHKIDGNNIKVVEFDFTDPTTFDQALSGTTRVFLVRPPPLDDATLFEPFLDTAVEYGINHVIFLSLLGINPLTPHWGIERRIKKRGFHYTFLRAGFFMQNIVNFHLRDIKVHDEIYIPAGGGKTSFIDNRDVAEVAAFVLTSGEYYNAVLKLTGAEKLSYHQIADILSDVTGRDIWYSNPSGKEFKTRMREYGYQDKFINVMINLYRITKFRLAGKITNDVETVLEKEPRDFLNFSTDYKKEFCKMD